MNEQEKKQVINEMEEVMQSKELVIDPEISTLGGMLYAAIIKRVLDDTWKDSYALYLSNMKEELIKLNGSIDTDSCLVEMSAAQISGPAIESGYNVTFEVVEEAGKILDTDVKKLTEPKYISKGQKFINSLKKYPKKLLIAALAGGILFCGSPGSPVLMGPKPAEASGLIGLATGIILSGLDIYSSGSEIKIEYDSDYVKNKAASYIASSIIDTVNSTANDIPKILQNKPESHQKQAATLIRRIENSKYNFTEKESCTILKSMYLINELSGLKANELVLTVVMLAPDMTNERIQNISTFISSIGKIENEKLLFSEYEANAASAILVKNEDGFDKNETLIRFIASAAKISERIMETDNVKCRDVMKNLLEKVYVMSKNTYNNPTINTMLERAIGRETELDRQNEFQEQIESAPVFSEVASVSANTDILAPEVEAQ